MRKIALVAIITALIAQPALAQQESTNGNQRTEQSATTACRPVSPAPIVTAGRPYLIGPVTRGCKPGLTRVEETGMTQSCRESPPAAVWTSRPALRPHVTRACLEHERSMASNRETPVRTAGWLHRGSPS